MKIQVVRTQFGIDATNGLMYIDGKFECYTLEDQYQAVKVMHETCIPEGTYDIKFRKVGGFHQKYSARYKNAHYGMLELQNVPGFQYILIHPGRSEEHTSNSSHITISYAVFCLKKKKKNKTKKQKKKNKNLKKKKNIIIQ